MLTDAAIHIPPEYESFSPPFVGERYADPVFGSSIRSN